ACTEYNYKWFVNDLKNPYTTPPDKPFNWIRLRVLGGRSLVWGRVSLRLSDLDFKAASRDGYGEDWPIKAYQEALGLNPRNEQLNINLGLAFLKSSRYEEAGTHFPGRFLTSRTTLEVRNCWLFAISNWNSTNWPPSKPSVFTHGTRGRHR